MPDTAREVVGDPPSLELASKHAFNAYWGAKDRSMESLASALIEIIRYLKAKEASNA